MIDSVLKHGRAALRIMLAVVSAGIAYAPGARAGAPQTLRVDYAYYNPLSLVLKDKHWLEDSVGPNVTVQWVFSAGSNKALEYLRGRSLDIGSTAGAAALLGRANGTPAKVAYVYSRPEWSALVTRPGSGISSLADLKGKRVAATPGTDPGILLLRALATVKLGRSDITLVPLQHQDGRLALDRGDVDAWAGLDPFMAQAELQHHDVLFYRNRAFNSPGTLLVRDDVLAQQPDLVRHVLAAYERARAWAQANPQGVVTILSAAAKLPPDVAARELGRVDLGNSQVDAGTRAQIAAAAPILKASGSLTAGADLDQALASLFDASVAAQ